MSSDVEEIAEGAEDGLSYTQRVSGAIGLGGLGTSLESYINRDATLLGKVDFAGMVSDIGKGFLVAIMSLLAGGVLAARQGWASLYEASRDSVVGIINAVLTGLVPFMETALDSAAAEIRGLGFLGLPASVTVALAGFVVITAGIYLWFGGD